jgi:hypothetical protein
MTDADLPSDGVNGAEAREAYERGYNLFHTFGGKSRHEGGLLAVARLAQQRERERLVAAAGDAVERVGHAPLCDWGLGACSCGSIDAIAAIQARHEAEIARLNDLLSRTCGPQALEDLRTQHAAEVRELRAALEAAEIALEHMGDVLNGMDAVDESDEAIFPVFALVRIALGHPRDDDAEEAAEWDAEKARAALSTKVGGA